MIPGPIYEFMPYGYFIAGLLAIYGLETNLGKVCGVLLISSGVLIYKMRRNYRGGYQKSLSLKKKSQKKFTRKIGGIPGPVYESLPYGYFFVGLFAVVMLEAIIGKVCGVLLMSSGILIYKMRRNYRYRKVQPTDDRSTTTNSRRISEEPVSQRTIHPEQDFESGAMSEETRDYQRAVQWYRQAAEQGYAPAQVNLGTLYAEGNGVAQDIQMALQWYQKAAAQNYAPAQFNLGVLYISGSKEIAKDPVLAYVWFSRAAAQEDEDAQQAQGTIAAELTADQKMRADEFLSRSWE